MQGYHYPFYLVLCSSNRSLRFSVRWLRLARLFNFMQYTDIGEKINNHGHTNKDNENINERIALESSSNDDLELFNRALSEALDSKICEIEEEINQIFLKPIKKL